ncbi:MAG: thiamine phosphate synthase [Mycobacteriales bacterium]
MATAFDPTLYLVTDTAMCGPRGVTATVRAAVVGGVTAVQLRDHAATTRELCAAATDLLDALAGTNVAVIVNDRLDVALAVGADGVHLGQQDLPVTAARRLAGDDLIIGLSTSRAEQIERVNALPPGTVSYIGIGPVFFTTTKPHAATPVTVARVAELCPTSSVPTVAIGGINASNVAAVRATGISGIAVVSAICTADDPQAAAAALHEGVALGVGTALHLDATR